MQLINFREHNVNNLHKWLVDVVWEDSDRPIKTIYVTLPIEFNCSLFAAANGFLLAVIVYAMNHGEHRVYVESNIDLWLKYRLEKSLNYLAMWFAHSKIPTIECCSSTLNPSITSTKLMKEVRSTAVFLSGGVDSYCTLTRNTNAINNTHPKRIRYGLLVNGLDIGYQGEGESTPSQQALTDISYKAIDQVCKNSGIQSILIDTNIRSLDPNSILYAKQAHGAILAGMAHFLTSDISDILISSTNDMRHAAAWGSSPLIDVNYSSELLSVHHDSEDLSRLDKIKLIIENPNILKNLRVCPKVYNIPSGFLNCGKCEKCVRTRLELLVLGYKNEFGTFPNIPESIWLTEENLLIQSDYHASQFEELIEPLQKLGLNNILSIVLHSIEKWHRYQAWRNQENIVGLTKKLIKTAFLNSKLLKSSKKSSAKH